MNACGRNLSVVSVFGGTKTLGRGNGSKCRRLRCDGPIKFSNEMLEAYGMHGMSNHGMH